MMTKFNKINKNKEPEDDVSNITWALVIKHFSAPQFLQKTVVSFLRFVYIYLYIYNMLYVLLSFVLL